MKNLDRVGLFVFKTKDNNDINKQIEIARNFICSSIKENDYDTAVTIFVMCINKTLSDKMNTIDFESDTFYKDVDEKAKNLEEALISELINSLRLSENDNNIVYLKYIKYLLEAIFKSFKKHYIVTSKNEIYTAFTQWDRALKLYDNMMGLIPEYKYQKSTEELKKFTKDHDIQIPYVYGFVLNYTAYFILNKNEVEKIFKDINMDSEGNCIFTGKYIDDLGGKFITYEYKAKQLLRCIKNNSMLFNPEEKKEGTGIQRLGHEYKEIDLELSKYLPSICDGKENFIENKYFIDKCKLLITEDNTSSVDIKIKQDIHKHWYCSIPMCPYYIQNRIIENDLISIRKDLYENTVHHALENIKNKELERMTLEQKNQELEQARKDKNEVINDFSHTYKNMRATSLLEVANALFATGDEELMKHGRTVLLEYSTKQALTKNVEMLQLRFEDKIEKLRKKIRASIYSTRSQCEPSTIHQLLSNAFKRCLITLFHDKKDGKSMRNGFRENANFSKMLGPLCKQFEEQILFKQDGDVFNWFVNNMVFVQSDISNTWETILFEEDNYAAIMITDLLAELTTNMFKYADKSKSIYYQFTEEEDRLIVKIINSTILEIENSSDNGKGLFSKSETFRLLNKAGNIEGNAIMN